MKYEPVFGDQSLFDGAPEDAEYVAIDGTRDRLIFYKDIAVGDYYSFFDRNSSHWRINDGHPYYSINSMRRIIQEPKRWTVEDQKVGRLPEVGASLTHESEGDASFIGEYDGRWMLRTKYNGLYLAEKFYCYPIETPEEKAERLRSEWCANAAKQLKHFEYSSTLTRIYDALLSGALSAPTKGGE